MNASPGPSERKRVSRAWLRNRCFRRPVLALVGIFVIPALAQPPSEYQVKAAYVYNFAKATEWPAGALPAADSALVIGVFGGNDDFFRVLQETLAGKKANGHALLVRSVHSTSDSRMCQVVFFRAFDPHAPSAMAELAGSAILLIGEDPAFLSRGGMINLALRNGRVTFEVNPEALDRAGLRYGSETPARSKSPETTIHSAGSRAVKSQISPDYPDIARNMALKGTVQLQAVVRADGSVKEVHILGGHPVLAAAAEEAVLKWRYESDSKETLETVKISFGPN